MKLIYLFLAFILCFGTVCFAQEKGLLIDDFEGVISGGAQGTVDFGSGNGSTVQVTQDKAVTHSGKQSLKVDFNAVSGGYIYVAKGFGLDAKNSAWLVKPENIDWKNYNAFSFFMHGNNSKAKLAFDIKDSGNEIWRLEVTDDFGGWKQIVCLFTGFSARSDWQPDSAEKNGQIDFPIKSYQFEPLPEAKGIFYFDEVKLINS